MTKKEMESPGMAGITQLQKFSVEVQEKLYSG